jgi:hypothetical protein
MYDVLKDITGAVQGQAAVGQIQDALGGLAGQH